MRALWTSELVTFEGRWHRVHGRGDQSIARAAPHPDLVRRERRPCAETDSQDGGRVDLQSSPAGRHGPADSRQPAGLR